MGMGDAASCHGVAGTPVSVSSAASVTSKGSWAVMSKSSTCTVAVVKGDPTS
jgi:hypothetical protein